MGETFDLADQTGRRPDEDERARRKRGARRRYGVLLVLLLLLVGGAFGGRYWLTVGRFIESTDDAYVRSDIAVISPQIQGYVREVRVADNQTVAKGEVLVVIEAREFAAHLAEAKAELAARVAGLRSIEGQIDLQSSMIDQAAAALERARADLTLARQDYERYQRLSRQETASRQTFQKAAADLRRAEAGQEQAEAALAAAHDRRGVLEAERAKADAERQQAEAALELAKTDLDHAVIRAPFNGVVGNKGVRVGELVRPGTQLLSVVPLPHVYVVANFKETQLDRMRPGQRVELEVDAFPGHTLYGTLESFAPATGSEFSLLPPENATGNFTKIVQRVPVRIAVPPDNPLAGLLRPGLSVVASVDTRTRAEGAARVEGVLGAAQAGPVSDVR
ncbi:MAG: HlyD family secretion protein [Geminicoccaceae bacterium]